MRCELAPSRCRAAMLGDGALMLLEARNPPPQRVIQTSHPPHGLQRRSFPVACPCAMQTPIFVI